MLLFQIIAVSDLFAIFLFRWHIAGGEGQTANTSIKRVLKTNPDGSQEVVMVENDLDRKIAARAGPSHAGMEI